jgi:hypothetical protein
MKKRKKYKKSIELFHEKSGDIVRTLRFKQEKDFKNFKYAFNSMRYPGYKWRIRDNKNKNRIRK